MTLRHAIWTVGSAPAPLVPATLRSEAELEAMIVAAPGMLSDAWMLIGQQERTAHGGRLDLLAIAPDGGLVLIEIKRDRSPREVVAQALDYASWVETLKPEDITAIYARFAPGRSLSEEFRARFGQPLDEEALNASHQVVIVAAALDSDSERIVAYLNARGIAINVLCFQVFAHAGGQFLSRAWLLDPTAQAVPEPAVVPGTTKEPWNGECYACFGAGEARSWEDARRFSFISAGNGTWYSNTLRSLSAGDRVWVKSPRHGFVGVGRVTGPAEPAQAFRVATPQGDRPVLEVAKGGHYFADLADDTERCEWFVPIAWLDTASLDKAMDEFGLFGNQNTVCRPTTPKWRLTVERLRVRFPTTTRRLCYPPGSNRCCPCLDGARVSPASCIL